jgi:hypothetical protein
MAATLDIANLGAPTLGTHNQVFDEQTLKIRATQIPWDVRFDAATVRCHTKRATSKKAPLTRANEIKGYAQANLATPQQVQAMKSLNPENLSSVRTTCSFEKALLNDSNDEAYTRRNKHKLSCN